MQWSEEKKGKEKCGWRKVDKWGRRKGKKHVDGVEKLDKIEGRGKKKKTGRARKCIEK